MELYGQADLHRNGVAEVVSASEAGEEQIYASPALVQFLNSRVVGKISDRMRDGCARGGRASGGRSQLGSRGNAITEVNGANDAGDDHITTHRAWIMLLVHKDGRLGGCRATVGRALVDAHGNAVSEVGDCGKDCTDAQPATSDDDDDAQNATSTILGGIDVAGREFAPLWYCSYTRTLG